MKLNAASTIQKAKNRALAAVVITRYETHGDFKHKSSEGQNCTKSTRTELLNLCQSQFGAIRRMYHELREKEAALQNVEDLNMRAELEAEFEEESASTNRHTIGVMRLIGKLFVWKMITLVLYVVTGYCFTWWTCEHSAHASAASQLKFIILELIISTARNKTGCKRVDTASRSGKSQEIFVQMLFKKGLVAMGTHWTGCPAPLYPTTVLLLGPPASQSRILPA
ncbi:hypothetical protein T01_13853 [Trichinella spiralis]|uniref:Uncharacterized protein n=1 Tax=Trichinella spiralis TaxID=6334 RepID=A0A0V1ALV2_TRISP|nr:hypothetical protein T01_13853 [Trichinella spiralis]